MMNALIIGGSRGIGRATANLLTQNGWHVVAYGREQYDVRHTKNSNLFNLIHDADECGRYDAFVYCAGDLTVRGLDAFRFSMSFYSIVQEQGVKIFNEGCKILAVSSIAVDRPAKFNPDYAAAKAALDHYAMTLRHSALALKHNWHVSVIHFDLVDTSMLRPLYEQGRLDTSRREYIKPETAAERICEKIVEKH